ncbi:MAG TPA: sugar phosphate isomerase/epimerase family protein [Polyangia bacterium]|nr:sugar phosphate isomerase/epimerase family protein [Polyangia bacterium]
MANILGPRRLPWAWLVSVLGVAVLAPASSVQAAQPKIKIGYNTDDLEKGKAFGFDYVELLVKNFTALSDEDFAKFLQKHKAVGIPTPVGNNFIPVELKLVGPEVDKDKQMEFVKKAFERAQKLGIKTVVLGSGGARKLPDGFSADEGWKQLVDFARRIAPEAKKRGIVVAVEPLQKGETNTINTAAEGLKWVKEVNHPNFQLMVDFYHLSLEKEDPAILLTAKKNIKHLHIANPYLRRFPMSSDEFDYSVFFATLKKSGYQGGLTIEGKTDKLDEEAPRSLAFLRGAVSEGVKPPSGPTPPATPAPRVPAPPAAAKAAPTPAPAAPAPKPAY